MTEPDTSDAQLADASLDDGMPSPSESEELAESPSMANEPEELVESSATPEESESPDEVEPSDGAESGEEITPAQVIEALLFSSDAPVSAGRLAELAGAGSAKEVRRLVAELNEKYAQVGLTFRIDEIARGYQMLSRAEYRPWLMKLNKHHAQTRLSNAALEALAIVAYKQPVIRADIEAIRGVSSGEMLNRLREMGLVKIIGRAEIVGRPMLYGTTRKFLDVFGLADLDDLPPMETLMLRKPTVAPEPATADDDAVPPSIAAAGA